MCFSGRRLLLAVVGAGAFLAAVSVSAQVNTFTSGNPPIGDGNQYPTSLNPASQSSGGGASSRSFFANNGVGFTSLNGNPAFFDSNNLLTRPATLITGDAFWSDPRIGNFTNADGSPFDVSLMSFELPAFTSSFGFDLAVASASADVPLVLEFNIQTFDFEGGLGGPGEAFGFGQLLLTGSGGGVTVLGNGDGQITPFSSGTFSTIGPRTGREARYRIDTADLLSFIQFDEGFGGPEDPEDPESDPDFEEFTPTLDNGFFIDINLRPISTFGGTTQIAIDNFVLDNAPIPNGPPDPTFLFTEFPAGENRPQYLNYDAEVVPDNADGDTYDFDPTQFDGPITKVLVDIEEPAGELGAKSFTKDVSIYFDSNAPDDGLQAHEVTHSTQTILDQDQLPEESAILGGDTKIQSILDEVGDPDAPAQIVEITTTIDAGADGAARLIRRTIQNLEEEGPGIISIPVPGDEPADLFDPGGLGETVTLLGIKAHDLIDQVPDEQSLQVSDGEDDLSSLFLSFSSEASVSDVLLDATQGPMYYANTAVSTYLAIKDDAGEELVIGDQGFFITPIFDDEGELLTYSVQTWLITDENGIFTPVLTNVPEPTSLALIAAGGLLLERRRRR